MRGEHQRRRPLLARIGLFLLAIIGFVLYVVAATGLLVLVGLILYTKAMS